MPSFNHVGMLPNALESRASETGTLGLKESHLEYQWGDFETEEDLAEAELYECTSGAKVTDEFSCPFRDPESPLDEWDVDQFNVKTASLASCTDSCSCRDLNDDPEFVPEIPTIRPMESLIAYEDESGSHSSLPPPMMTLADQQDLLAATERLEHKVAFLEASIEQNHNSLEQEMLGKCEKFSDGIEGIVELLVSGLHNLNNEHLTKTDNPTNGADAHLADHSCKPPTFPLTTATAPHDQTTPPQSPKTVLSPIGQYIQSWHLGGLILIEHLSEQTLARDIHALFQPYGRITYLELHGADKSKPHVPTRHAYIHYAERSQALEARRNLHGFRFQNRNLMVFAISTAIVRGEPGKPYMGSALEVLNFNGGSNYASLDADCFQIENEGLMLLDGESPFPKYNLEAGNEELVRFSDSVTKKEDAKVQATYSLKPTLTGKTTAASWWRRMDAEADAEAATQYRDGEYIDGGETILFQGRDVRNHPTILHDIVEYSEGEEEKEEEEEGGVFLDLEAGVFLPLDYDSEDEEEGLEFCIPVQPREFL
ncbi:MAG: hypothetical protein Q9188_000754 [Gyalolechia gomerana]